jgi:hypothetical protein
MPYKFGEYVSTYVDPQSAKISETLRDRFVQNFQANDQLTMAVDQLQAASMFESDVQRKKELQRLTENELAKLAEQGNYENLGMAIAKQTKDYVQAKAPIEQNYKAVQSFLGDFSKGLEKGDYTPEQQKLLGTYMLKTGTGEAYKGFEIDPATGRPTEGSMWKAPTLYKDPKIMDKISKAAQMFHERRTGSVVERVGQGEGGMYATEQGGTLSQILPEDVDAAWAAVMAEPGVKAYFDQIADMQATSYQMNGQLPQVMTAQIEGYNNAINELNTALGNSKNSSERTQIKAQLDSYTKELNAAKEASADPNMAYNYIKSKSVEQQLKPFKDLLDTKGGIYEQTSIDKVKYDQKKLDEINRLEQWKLDHPEMTTTSPVNATAWGGKDAAEKAQNIANYKKEAAELTAAAAEEDLDPAQKEKYLVQARQALQNAGLIEQQLITAGDKAFTMDELKAKDPSLVEAVMRAYPNATAGQIYAKISSLEKGSTEYNQIGDAFKNLYGSNLDGHMVMYYAEPGQGVTQVQDLEYSGAGLMARNTAAEAQAYIEKIKSGQFGFTPRGEFIVKEVPSNATQNGKQYVVLNVDSNAPINITGSWAGLNDNKATKTLKETKTSSVGYSGQMPGVSTQGKVKATNAFNAYFGKNFTLGENQILTLPDGTNLKGADLAGFQSTGAYTFYPKIGSAQGSTEITFTKTVDGKTQLITGYFDNQQASNEEVRNYLSSDEFRFATTVDRMDPKGNGEISLGLNLDPKNPEPTFTMTVKNGANNEPLVRFESVDKPGTGLFRGIDSPEIVGSYDKNGQWSPGWMQVVAPSLP